mgnify:CR=1 FL=1
MKKFINQVELVEDQMIQGMVKAYPQYVRKLDCGNVVVRTEKKEGKVALISGGGSGHEPAHGGYVGTGMLDAAVAGAVFTSPTPDQIYEGIKAIATDKGVLMVIKNYTGDVMNFEMAGEMAQMDDIKVAQVVVNDDVAVDGSLYTVGRRGVAGRHVGADEEGVPRPQDESPALQLQRPPAGDHIVDQIVVPDAGTPGVARRTLLKSGIVDHQRQLRPVRRLEGVLEALRHIRHPSLLHSYQQHTGCGGRMQLKSMEKRRE